MIGRQFVRWAIVGVVVNALLFAAYVALTRSLLQPTEAMTVVYVASVGVSFIANKYWSFGHTGHTGPALLRYAATYALGYVVNLVGLRLGISLLHLPHELVQGTMILVVALLTFVLQKFIVFVGRPAVERDDATQGS